MDDLYLIHESKEYLQECLQTIVELCAKLKLTVNMNKTRVVKLSEGVDFLKGKYRLLPSGSRTALQNSRTPKRPVSSLKRAGALRSLLAARSLSARPRRKSRRS
jgi:hypothetical protein